MIKLNKRTDAVKYAVLLAAGLCANDAFAFQSVADSVTRTCQTAGNAMVVSVNSCTACHNDGNGGSGAGKTAASGSNPTILSFFCPTVIEATTTTPAAATPTTTTGPDLYRC